MDEEELSKLGRGELKEIILHLLKSLDLCEDKIPTIESIFRERGNEWDYYYPRTYIFHLN